jgi:hypothetical protein
MAFSELRLIHDGLRISVRPVTRSNGEISTVEVNVVNTAGRRHDDARTPARGGEARALDTESLAATLVHEDGRAHNVKVRRVDGQKLAFSCPAC